jgi:hypothetical protein
MKRTILISLALTLMALNTYAENNTRQPPMSLFTGQTYIEMGQADRIAYAVGVVEGMALAHFFDAPEAKLKWLHTTVAGMTPGQLAASLLSYIRERPYDWQKPLNVLSYEALAQAFNQKQK